MTFAIHVKGGTGAGSKRKPKELRWTHDCKTFGTSISNRALTTYSCPDCGTRRPTRPRTLPDPTRLEGIKR